MNLKKTVLVVGGDGRGHALAWKCAQSPDVAKVYVAPGNGGTLTEPKVENVPILVTEAAKLLEFALNKLDKDTDMTVVSPEGPLAEGIVDDFRAHGLKIFGPTKAAARLETSKAWAKEFMRRHWIPTAGFRVFTDVAEAHVYVEMHGVPIVIKGDGLAAGKGVVVATTLQEAHDAIHAFMTEDKLKGSGKTVVIEDCLVGEEASFMVMVDTKGHVLPLATSQDHKRLLDGDKGDMTGGMGAYSPAPVITPVLYECIMQTIVMPTVKDMEEDGVPYVGFLYFGLMIDAEGNPYVLEFNCRLGDPETQPILMRLQSDLVTLISHALSGTLGQVEAVWDPRPALGVVLAAAGYPDNPRKGDVITGIPVATEDTHVFHAGTAMKGNDLVIAGGRGLCVTALGTDHFDAQLLAYEVASQIHIPDVQFRRDIGHRAIGR